MLKNIYIIASKEIKSYFLLPSTYVAIAFFLLLSGYLFNGLLHSFFKTMALANLPEYDSLVVNINTLFLSPFILNLSFVASIILPILTMGTLAEERKLSTIELLFTSPITNWEIVIGKFFAVLTLYTFLLTITFSYSVFISFYGEVEFLPVFVGYCGLFLMGATLISLGIFISSTTESQILAAIGTFVVFFLLWVIKSIAPALGETWESILLYVSVVNHVSSFSRGIFELRNVIFYLSAISFALFLTRNSLESNKWKG
ncbi:ABC transporter permease subunit [bacterium]|nr:ABC transporter permease subunit [bacterium]